MSLNKNWELKVDDKVYKQIRKFPKKDIVQIIDAIEILPQDPYLGDIQKIQGEKYVWRRRIGAYRFFYEVYPRRKMINVFWVERRTTRTYKR